jgi:hypothetical protein
VSSAGKAKPKHAKFDWERHQVHEVGSREEFEEYRQGLPFAITSYQNQSGPGYKVYACAEVRPLIITMIMVMIIITISTTLIAAQTGRCGAREEVQSNLW